MTENKRCCFNCYNYSFDDGEMWCIYSTPMQKISDENLAKKCKHFEVPFKDW